MTCNKCGKELEENTKICDSCGEAVAEASTPKKKKNKKLIAIIAAVVAVIILVFSLGSGDDTIENHDEEKSNENINSYLVETGFDDAFGGVSFDITFEEFIEKHNAYVDEDEEYELVKEMRFLSKEDFSKNTQEKNKFDTKLIIYSKKFGTDYQNLGTLDIYVNGENDKIQMIEWRTFESEAKFNSEEAVTNYQFVLPASFFSLVDDEIDFPYDDNPKSYAGLFSEILDKGDGLIVKGDSFYKLLWNESGVFSITFSAAKEGSNWYNAFALK